MTYKDYKSRIWRVKESNLPECTMGDHVQFIGPHDDVTVKCKGTEQYKGGKYNKGSGTIEKQGEYTISIVATEPKYEIRFEKQTSKSRGLKGGSWIAEDHTPGLVA